jgi:hypothetical protein
MKYVFPFQLLSLFPAVELKKIVDDMYKSYSSSLCNLLNFSFHFMDLKVTDHVSHSCKILSLGKQNIFKCCVSYEDILLWLFIIKIFQYAITDIKINNS